jgi:acetolactate synthase-1/2/3 large subunit
MKLSDYVMRFVADAGVKHVFMLPGGGAMHLNDSLRRADGLQFVCNLHEQASAIAAEAYCRVTGNLGVAMVTTGPGGTNAVTGVACAWLDSTPCLFISGQVKRSDLIGSSGLRQLGVQEIDIVSIVKPITKYAATVMDPNDIRRHLEQALYLAKAGRPGPVWIDIPLDVQSAEIDPEALTGRVGGADESDKSDEPALSGWVSQTIALLNASERPVLLVGNGVRVAGAVDDLAHFIEILNIPVLTTCPGLDLIPDDHPLLVGRPGAVAPRGANFALQNADFLLSIGARLDMAMVGYSHRNFARAARKVVVDVDAAEIAKLDMNIAVKACCDAKAFMRRLLARTECELSETGRKGDLRQVDRSGWLTRCADWRTEYPVVTAEQRAQEDFVSTYVFADALSDAMPENETLVVGSSGAAIEIVFLCLRVKTGQRIFHNRGTGSMGLGLPQAIGACFANGGRRTILVEGDGSFQLNIQELQTVVTHNLPIKIFILDNQGFASIRLSQEKHFGGLIAADATSGLRLPDLLEVARAYGIRTERIESHEELPSKLAEVLDTPGPVLCQVAIAPDEPRMPSLASGRREDGTMASSALEDLWPFLPREEFLKNMLVAPLEDAR